MPRSILSLSNLGLTTTLALFVTSFVAVGCAAHRPAPVSIPLGIVGSATPTVSLDALSAQASVLGAVSFGDSDAANAQMLGDALRQVDQVEQKAEAWCNTPAYDLAACSTARRHQGDAWISLARAMRRAPAPAGLDAKGVADWQAGWALLTDRVEQRGQARLQVTDEAVEAAQTVASAEAPRSLLLATR